MAWRSTAEMESLAAAMTQVLASIPMGPSFERIASNIAHSLSG